MAVLILSMLTVAIRDTISFRMASTGVGWGGGCQAPKLPSLRNKEKCL